MKYVMGFEPTSVLHDTLESRNSSNFSVPNSRIILYIVLQWIKNRFMQVYIGDGEKSWNNTIRCSLEKRSHLVEHERANLNGKNSLATKQGQKIAYD